MLNLFQHPGGFSEYVTYSHSELVSESRRFFLVTHSLSFGRTENRSTVNQFLLPFRTRHLLPPTTVSRKPRSRIKSGMTTLDYRDNLAFRHSELVSESRRFFLVTHNLSFGRTESRSMANQFLLPLRTRCLLPPTTVSRKPRSRIKSGMTVLGDCEYVTSRHSELVSESRSFFLVAHSLFG